MKTIAKAWIFPSSSGRGTYETLQYDDASTSCNCPGWTRRVAVDGTRSCRHTRLVDMDRADVDCVSKTDYGRKVMAAADLHPVAATDCGSSRMGLIGARKLSL
jgi:hypothetical protein